MYVSILVVIKKQNCNFVANNEYKGILHINVIFKYIFCESKESATKFTMIAL